MLVMTTDDIQLYIWNKEDLKQIKYLLSQEAYNITTAKIYEAYNQYATECYERDEKLNLMVKKKLGDEYYIETHILPEIKENGNFDSSISFSFKKNNNEPITKKDEIIIKGYAKLCFQDLFPLSHRMVQIAQQQGEI